MFYIIWWISAQIDGTKIDVFIDVVFTFKRISRASEEGVSVVGKSGYAPEEKCIQFIL